MTLRGRLILGGVLILTVIVAVATTSRRALDELESAARLSRHSQVVLSTGDELLRAVTQAQTASRAAISTGDPVQLAAYGAALPRVTEHGRALQRLVADNPGQARRVRALRGTIDRYIADQRASLRRATARGLPRPTAELRARFRTGLRSLTRIERDYAAFAAVERRLGEARERHAADRRRHADAITIVGAGLVALLLVGFVVYLLRYVRTPLKTAADAADEVAAGRHGVRLQVREHMPEVRTLATAFNAMAAGLEDRQDELEAQRDALAEEAERNRAVTTGAPDAFVAVRDDRIADWNPKAQELWGWTAEEAIGRAVSDLYAEPALHRDVTHALADASAPGVTPSVRVRSTACDRRGRCFPVEISASLAQVDDRQKLLVMFTRDVSELAEADRLKDEFFALVSHELRTPLTSIIGYLETVRQDADLDPAMRDQFLAVVERNAQRLLRLVGDILFATQTGTGDVRLLLTPVNPERVLAGSVVAARPAAEARSIELRTEIEPLPPVSGDPDRLGQLVDNLLSNALKFSPAESLVTVRARQEGDDVVVEVEDRGLGVPAADQSRLFDRFFRARNASAHEVPGAGLGLNISRAIARAHGGDLTFTSTEGEGTTFVLRIPAAPVVLPTPEA